MKIEIYRREDDKFAFRVRASNGKIIAVDGSQGYENQQDAIDTAQLLTGARTRSDFAVEMSFLPGATEQF